MVNNKKTDSTDEKILEAARKIFLLKGMAGARMQDIADEAGINKAMLHYYFRNKEQLFEMIFKDALNKLLPKIVEIIDSERSLFEKIENFCVQYIEMMQQNNYLPLFVLNEINKDPILFKERFFGNNELPLQRFVAQIDAEIRAGTIKVVNPAHLFINMLSMCIFPFIAKPIWMMASGMDDLQFRYFMKQRKTEVAKFIIESIKK